MYAGCACGEETKPSLAATGPALCRAALAWPIGRRYTEWVRWNGTVLQASWDRVEGVELYTHPGDEGTNLALQPGQRDAVSVLSQQLRAAFGGPPRLDLDLGLGRRGGGQASDEF